MDASGRLESTELRALLTELNDDIPPLQHEVEWVRDTARHCALLRAAVPTHRLAVVPVC